MLCCQAFLGPRGNTHHHQSGGRAANCASKKTSGCAACSAVISGHPRGPQCASLEGASGACKHQYLRRLMVCSLPSSPAPAGQEQLFLQRGCSMWKRHTTSYARGGLYVNLNASPHSKVSGRTILCATSSPLPASDGPASAAASATPGLSCNVRVRMQAC